MKAEIIADSGVKFISVDRDAAAAADDDGDDDKVHDDQVSSADDEVACWGRYKNSRVITPSSYDRTIRQ